MNYDNIPLQLRKYIDTRDKKYSLYDGENPLQREFALLLEGREIEFGGRFSTGNNRSYNLYIAWQQIIKKSRRMGFEITEQEVKHDNAWASVAGGFWQSKKYKLTKINNTTPK